MVFNNINKYNFSIVLFLFISIVLFLNYRLEILSLSLKFLFQVNYLFFIVSGLLGFIAAVSFIFPYATYIYFRKIKISFKKMFFNIMNFVYYDVIGMESDNFLAKKLNVKNKKYMFDIIRLADICSISIIFFVLIFFIKNINLLKFFLIILFMELLYTIFRIIRYRKEIKNEGVKKFFVYVASCITRYFFEFPRTALMFYAIGMFLDIQTIFLFLVSSSFLYFIPKFKSAGGLLELYMAILFPVLGKTMLEGFIVAGLFRVSGLIFHILPIYLYKKFFKK